MKIAFLAPRYHSNQVKLVEYLSEKNTVEFYVTRIGNSEDHNILKPKIIQLSKLNNFFKRFKHKNDALYEYKFCLPKFKELLNFKKENFDVVIIRDPYSFISIFFALTAKINSTKIIFYTQRDIHRRNTISNDFAFNLLIKFFSAKWISPCLGDRNKYNKKNSHIYYIPFCMDIENYEKIWFKDDVINILTIGKFVERKNHHLLINALKNLSKKFKFRLTIIGELSNTTGNEYYEKIIELSKNVDFKIDIKLNMKRNEVFNEYKNHDIFILASRNEPASVSNLEAMAFGLPIITSDTNKTSIYTQNSGFIFKSDSEIDLTRQLDKLLISRTNIIDMGKESLNTVKRNHNSQNVYKYFYEKVLND